MNVIVFNYSNRWIIFHYESHVFICSSDDEHLGLVSMLAVVNSTAANVVVQVSLIE